MAELNQWQKENLANEKLWEFPKRDVRQWSSMLASCTKCGGRVTYGNMEHAGWDPLKVTCYTCQENFCKLCGAPIVWRHSPKGRWLPYNKVGGDVHPYTCDKRYTKEKPPAQVDDRTIIH